MFGNMNIAILGTGNIAAMMAGTLRHVKKAKLYAVGSRNMDKAVGFAKQHGFKKAYGSYEELASDKKVDLIYIATPHSEHFANAKMCIEHGKAVLVEKPFTVNVQQAEELFRLAEEKNVFICEAMWVRFMPFLRTIQETVNSGIIGDPTMLSANLCYNLRGVQRMVDPELAGGSLLDVGVYPLNFASMIFGDDILRINATCTYTDRHLDEQDNIALVYRNGRMASLTAGMLGVSDRRGVITGTKGCIVVENINNFESLTVYDNNNKKIEYYKRPRQYSGYEYEIIAAMKAIREGRTECMEMTHNQTLSMMHMMDFIRSQFGIVYPFEMPAPEEVPVPAITVQTEEEHQNISSTAFADTVVQSMTQQISAGPEPTESIFKPVTENDSMPSEAVLPAAGDAAAEASSEDLPVNEGVSLELTSGGETLPAADSPVPEEALQSVQPETAMSEIPEEAKTAVTE